MGSLNQVFLVGHLTRHPDCRYTTGGTAVGSFGLAINRRYYNRRGEEKEDACFVEIELVGEEAEKARANLSKGDLAFVEGRLRTAEWLDKRKGVKRRKLKVTAKLVQPLP